MGEVEDGLGGNVRRGRGEVLVGCVGWVAYGGWLEVGGG